MEDKSIVELFWNRSEQGLEELNRKYGTFLFRIAFNLLSNKEDSEECVNDTYLKTWNSIPEEHPDSLKLYTGRITRNLAINRIKSKSAEKRGQQLTEMLSELSECIPSSDNPITDYEFKVLQDCIRSYVSELDDLNQCIFVRRYWMGETIGNIAKQTALSENAVSGRLFRMRSALKEKLEATGYTV